VAGGLGILLLRRAPRLQPALADAAPDEAALY
jgi:hypothetical protein